MRGMRPSRRSHARADQFAKELELVVPASRACLVRRELSLAHTKLALQARNLMPRNESKQQPAAFAGDSNRLFHAKKPPKSLFDGFSNLVAFALVAG